MEIENETKAEYSPDLNAFFDRVEKTAERKTKALRDEKAKLEKRVKAVWVKIEKARVEAQSQNPKTRAKARVRITRLLAKVGKYKKNRTVEIVSSPYFSRYTHPNDGKFKTQSAVHYSRLGTFDFKDATPQPEKKLRHLVALNDFGGYHAPNWLNPKTQTIHKAYYNALMLHAQKNGVKVSLKGVSLDEFEAGVEAYAQTFTGGLQGKALDLIHSNLESPQSQNAFGILAFFSQNANPITTLATFRKEAQNRRMAVFLKSDLSEISQYQTQRITRLVRKEKRLKKAKTRLWA